MSASDLLNKANAALAAVTAYKDAENAQIDTLKADLASAQANQADPAIEAQISDVLDQITAKVS